MELGKLLSLLGGLVSVVDMFLLAWFVVEVSGTNYYGHAIGVFMSIIPALANAESLAAGRCQRYHFS